MTIVLVEQMADLALAALDRAYVLEIDGVQLEGTGKELLDRAVARVAYLGWPLSLSCRLTSFCAASVGVTLFHSRPAFRHSEKL